MKKLKPCPFCGGAPHIEKNSVITPFRDNVIYCEGCGIYFLLNDVYAKEEDLVEAWNRRMTIGVILPTRWIKG